MLRSRRNLSFLLRPINSVTADFWLTSSLLAPSCKLFCAECSTALELDETFPCLPSCQSMHNLQLCASQKDRVSRSAYFPFHPHLVRDRAPFRAQTKSTWPYPSRGQPSYQFLHALKQRVVFATTAVAIGSRWLLRQHSCASLLSMVTDVFKTDGEARDKIRHI